MIFFSPFLKFVILICDKSRTLFQPVETHSFSFILSKFFLESQTGPPLFRKIYDSKKSAKPFEKASMLIFFRPSKAPAVRLLLVYMRWEHQSFHQWGEKVKSRRLFKMLFWRRYFFCDCLSIQVCSLHVLSGLRPWRKSFTTNCC